MIQSMAEAEANTQASIRDAAVRFYDKVFDCPMIGFMFHGVDRRYLVEREYELMAKVCGLTVTYKGRPLKAAHAKHRIRRGQFDRRMVLLEESLQSVGLSAGLKDSIMAHNMKLADLIVGDALKDPRCGHENDGGIEAGLKLYS